MSTAGKVLSVLVTLMAVVSILLAAPVAELNHNGAAAVEKLKADVAKLEEAVAETAHQIQSAKDATYQEQVLMQDELTTLQVRLSDAEKQRADVRQILARVQYKLSGVEAQIKSAADQAEIRGQELEDEKKAKDEAIAEVHKLHDENGELIKELTSLRNKFRDTLNQNRGSIGSSGVPVRSASLAR